MTTKEQELKALARIEKIVADLGEDSYLSFAFEGCFNIARENIENDFACSMKQRWESACREVESQKESINKLTTENKELKEETESLKSEIIPNDVKYEVRDTLKKYLIIIENEKSDSEIKAFDFLRDTDKSTDDYDFQSNVLKMRAMRNIINNTNRLIQLMA